MNAPLPRMGSGLGFRKTVRMSELSPALARALAHVGWSARRWSGRLGARGMGAVLLVLASGLAGVTLIRGSLHEIAGARAQLAAFQLHGRMEPGSKRGQPADDIDAFYRRFPPETAFPDALDALVRAAEQQGLVLNDGDYKVTREAAAQLVRFQIALPLRGAYPQVRLFLAELLAANASAAVANVQFSRAKVSDSGVDITVKVVFFMRRAR